MGDPKAVAQIAIDGQRRVQRGARGGRRGIVTVQRQHRDEEPITSAVNLYPARGVSAVTRGDDGAELPIVRHHPQEAAAPVPVRDGAAAVVDLASAVVTLLEAIAGDEPGDPDAPGRAQEHAPGSAESDRVLFLALIRVALELLEGHAPHRPVEPTDADLLGEVADLLGEGSTRQPPSSEEAGPEEPLTQGESRVLRYLPTHLSAREIAVELCLSSHTVRTHLRHLYRKLGAHSRTEAVHRARSTGLLGASSGRP